MQILRAHALLVTRLTEQSFVYPLTITSQVVQSLPERLAAQHGWYLNIIYLPVYYNIDKTIQI